MPGDSNEQATVDGVGSQDPPSSVAGSTATDDSLFAPEIREFPWVGAAINGATAFLVQYLIIVLVFVVGPAATRADTVMERLTTYAFVLFGAHNVPVVRSAQEITFEGPRRINLVTDAQDPTIPILVYLALPVVVLLVAGAVFYWLYGDGKGTFYERAALTGIGHGVGYFAVGILASFVFVATTTFDPGTVTEAVDRLAAVVSLLAYPLVFATLGALAVAGYRRYVA